MAILEQLQADFELTWSLGRRINGWIAVRGGDFAGAIGHMAASYSHDRAPGAVVDLAEVFAHVGFPNVDKRKGTIGLLATASKQWRQAGLGIYALPADLLVSKIVYGT